MRYPIKLVPQGIVPRDPGLKFTIARLTDVAPTRTPRMVTERIVLSGAYGSFIGPSIGTILAVTMIGAGTGGLSGADSGIAGGGGGAGMYIRRKPVIYTGPIDYEVVATVPSDTQVADTTFGDLTAYSATFEYVGALGGYIGVGGGNTASNGGDGYQLDEWTWVGANGGRNGGYVPAPGTTDNAHAGGASLIADADGASAPIIGGAAGVWNTSPETGSGPGGGGAGSAFGVGGAGGSLLPVEAGGDAASWGAGGGGGAGFAGSPAGGLSGGFGGGGIIIIEYLRPE